MILEVKTKLDTTPVIVSFDESPTSLWHIPFPAVTICPMTRARRSVFDFTKYIKFVLKNEDFLADFKKWLTVTMNNEGLGDNDILNEFPPLSKDTVLTDNDTTFLFGNSTLRNSV